MYVSVDFLAFKRYNALPMAGDNDIWRFFER